MDDSWTLIYSTGNPATAEIIKGMLEDNEISCVEINQKDSSYLFGEINLYVPVESETTARQLINTCNIE